VERWSSWGYNPTNTFADNGRYNVTKNEADRHAFKVPLLSNVTLTGELAAKPMR
jgi:cytochrome c peroxidase